MGRDQNMCSQGNLKRKVVTGGACQLLRLLLRASCFEVMLNRRMPNGMYCWWEGEIISPARFFTLWVRSGKCMSRTCRAVGNV